VPPGTSGRSQRIAPLRREEERSRQMFTVGNYHEAWASLSDDEYESEGEVLTGRAVAVRQQEDGIEIVTVRSVATGRLWDVAFDPTQGQASEAVWAELPAQS